MSLESVRWENGANYTGEFKNGLYNGLGTFIWSDMGQYKGCWKDGVRHGVGTYTSGDKSSMYDGEWCQDAMHGKGLQKLQNGRTFEGSIVNGLASIGLLTLPGWYALTEKRVGWGQIEMQST